MAPETPENRSDSTADLERQKDIPVGRLLILLIGSLSMLTGLIFPFPMTGRNWNAVFDFAHAPAFLLIFILTAGVLDPAAIGLPNGSRALVHLTSRRLMLLSGLLFCGGVASEVAQKFVDRHPSIGDIMANCAGLLSGTLYCVSLKSSQRWHRVIGIPLAMLIVAIPCIDSLEELTECVKQWQEFPLVASFERSRELTAWNGHGAALTCDSTWASHGSKSMRIEAYSDHQPGAVMVWPVPDWSDYSALQFDLFNPESHATNVGVTISDEQHVVHLWEPSDRFNISFELLPLEIKTVSISLKDVASSPVTRPMNMQCLSNLNIFIRDAHQGSKLHVDGILLLK